METGVWTLSLPSMDYLSFQSTLDCFWFLSFSPPTHCYGVLIKDSPILRCSKFESNMVLKCLWELNQRFERDVLIPMDRGGNFHASKMIICFSCQGWREMNKQTKGTLVTEFQKSLMNLLCKNTEECSREGVSSERCYSCNHAANTQQYNLGD